MNDSIHETKLIIELWINDHLYESPKELDEFVHAHIRQEAEDALKRFHASVLDDTYKEHFVTKTKRESYWKHD